MPYVWNTSAAALLIWALGASLRCAIPRDACVLMGQRLEFLDIKRIALVESASSENVQAWCRIPGTVAIFFAFDAAARLCFMFRYWSWMRAFR